MVAIKRLSVVTTGHNITVNNRHIGMNSGMEHKHGYIKSNNVGYPPGARDLVD